MKRPFAQPSGFSLIELLVAMGLLILVLGSMYSIFAFNQKTFSVQDQVLALNQNILGCTEVIGREARSAGLKVATDPAGKLGQVAQMIPSRFLPANPDPLPVSLNAGDYPVKVTQGSGTNPDAVTIIGAMGDATYPTKLTTAAPAGSTTITIEPGKAALYSVGDVIYVGEDFENAKVTGVSGSQLTIDTNAGAGGNQGLTRNHAQWSEVGRISVITYELSASPPALKRKLNDGPLQTVAADIINLQAVPNGNKTTMNLTARTAAPDPDYGSNGGYRQKVFSVSVAPKNIK